MVGELVALLVIFPYLDNGGEREGASEPEPLGKAVAVFEVEAGCGEGEGVHIFAVEPVVGRNVIEVMGIVGLEADFPHGQEQKGGVPDAELDVVTRKGLFPRGFLLRVEAECQSHCKDEEKDGFQIFHNYNINVCV